MAGQNLTQMADAVTRSLENYSILDTFIPGYSIISGLLVNILGVDISRLVPWLGFLLALSKLSDYFYEHIQHRFLKWFSCSIALSCDVREYDNVSSFLANVKSIGKRSSSLTIQMTTDKRTGRNVGTDPELDTSQETTGGKRRKHAPTAYEPNLNSFEYFWHNYRLFMWHRRQGNELYERTRRMGAESVEATLYCFSFTTDPIKQLIADAAAYAESRTTGLTVIHRPESNGQTFYGAWRCVAKRPSRPLSTVILDNDKKHALVADIERYLLPSTQRWYAKRGIPYRRGYLFSGSPGTGKTSLSLSLAGYLELDIYCFSLAEKSMTEEVMFQLFEELPEQCVVLLEDIDTAGLPKRYDVAADTETEHDEMTAAMYMPDVGRGAVSLSGLLNVLDGVASREGRVLIMTTNNVDALDPALLRPGRVDVRLHFGMASRQDACALFLHTFSDFEGDSADHKLDASMDLKGLAEQFAAQIPEKKFSPAEIQGYLLSWKDGTPEDAVSNVGTWASGEVAGFVNDLNGLDL